MTEATVSTRRAGPQDLDALAALFDLGLDQHRLQPLHRLVAVGMLRAFGLRLHHDARGTVGDPDRRFGLVDVLAAGA